MNLPIRLKKLRKSKNLTQEELATKLNCSRTTLANYEQGNRLPNIHFLNEIANFFKVSLDFLVNGTDCPVSLIPILSKKAASPILLLGCNEGKIVDANDKAIEFYGYSRKELLNMEISQISNFAKHEIIKRIAEILKGTKRKFYTHHIISDGTIKNVEVNCEPISYNNQTYLYTSIFKVKNFFNLDDNINQLAATFISKLISTIEYSIPYLTNHLKQVTDLSIQIGKELNLSQTKLNNIEVAAKLHDIGLFNIPKNIITKPNKLTKSEYKIIKQHPIEGNKILKNIDLIEPIPEIVLQHHENIDGSGYPKGLTDKDLHLESKIIRVADVIEAMASNRPYRTQYDDLIILDELRNQKGILYDPEVVDAALNLFLNKNYSFKSFQKEKSAPKILNLNFRSS